MSSENDVPLGEGSRRYYEQQFGERIRKVSKSGNTPPSNGGGWNWNGRAGAGLILGVIFIVIRIILVVARTDSSAPSYTYKPVVPQKLEADFHFRKHLNDVPIQDDAKDIQPDPAFGPLALIPNPANPQLDQRDVPLLEGLCYRIHTESQQFERTPGSRICRFLNADEQALITKAARGQALNRNERFDLIVSLKVVLQRADFFDGDSFRTVALPAELVLRHNADPNQPAEEIRQFNRSLLERCYPEQIVPLRERDTLDDQSREQWRKRARADLDKAKKEQAKR
ncbi:MAG TPA: hypothetical protein VN688_19320 [Gemmataceae bacterium]|nr:hypothetical protein [Gemmataceae bacterium]